MSASLLLSGAATQAERDVRRVQLQRRIQQLEEKQLQREMEEGRVGLAYKSRFERRLQELERSRRSRPERARAFLERIDTMLEEWDAVLENVQHDNGPLLHAKMNYLRVVDDLCDRWERDRDGYDRDRAAEYKRAEQEHIERRAERARRRTAAATSSKTYTFKQQTPQPRARPSTRRTLSSGSSSAGTSPPVQTLVTPPSTENEPEERRRPVMASTSSLDGDAPDPPRRRPPTPKEEEALKAVAKVLGAKASPKSSDTGQVRMPETKKEVEGVAAVAEVLSPSRSSARKKKKKKRRKPPTPQQLARRNFLSSDEEADDEAVLDGLGLGGSLASGKRGAGDATGTAKGKVTEEDDEYDFDF